jgi:hypothetical protein
MKRRSQITYYLRTAHGLAQLPQSQLKSLAVRIRSVYQATLKQRSSMPARTGPAMAHRKHGQRQRAWRRTIPHRRPGSLRYATHAGTASQGATAGRTSQHLFQDLASSMAKQASPQVPNRNPYAAM